MNQSLASFEFRGETSPVYDRINELEREVADYRQALEELGVTPDEARRGAERSRALHKEVAELRRDAEWQPIETAPKKETFLAILSCGGDQTICTMRWSVAESKNSRLDGNGYHVERVSHWMPLPKPPAMKEETK